MLSLQQVFDLAAKVPERYRVLVLVAAFGSHFVVFVPQHLPLHRELMAGCPSPGAEVVTDVIWSKGD